MRLADKLAADRAELLALVSELTEEQISTIPVVGDWTIKDTIGHIAHGEGMTLDHVRESFTEGRPRPVQADEIDEVMNPREVSKRKEWSWPRILAEYENVHRALIDKVNGLSEAELEFQVPSPWWNDHRFYSIVQMIEEDAVGHCREHIEQIRQSKRSRAFRERRWWNART